MLIAIPRQKFFEQLMVVTKTAASKSTIPSLEGVYIEIRPLAEDSAKITATAANTEMIITASSIYTVSEAKEVSAFALVLPVKIQDVVRRLPGETIQLLFDRENFAVTVFGQGHEARAQSEFRIFGFDPQDFPGTPSFTAPDLCLQMKSPDLRRALRQILFAISADESKPAFTGVHFRLLAEKLVLASSDTFRVATTSCRFSEFSHLKEGVGSFLAPGRLLQECVRTFGEGGRFQTEQTVTLKTERNKLLLESGEVMIFSRLLDENYPDVERVLPKEFAGSSAILTGELIACLERALVLTETGSPVLKFTFEKDGLTVKASSRYGKVQDRVAAKGEGADLEISLNARFLLDMLKVCEGEEVIFRHTGPNRGVLLKDDLYEEFRYFLLPIKS
ncbi:MAG: DNA polymerase III subunit beta [Syntrophomonadaceae bacterium]|nr:DNA polymerase III subunit beta [Bacillota bacterium]